MWWMVWVSAAMASDYFIEGPYVVSRTDAVRQQRTAGPLVSSVSIVRRFVDGEGWRFLLRATGFENLDQAEAAATTLARELDTSFDVLVVDGQVARLVSHLSAQPPPPPIDFEAAPEPGAVADSSLPLQPDPDDQASSDETAAEARGDAWPLLEGAAKAHGVDRDTLTSWMEGPSLFEYRRTLADGTVVDHRWATRDGEVFIEIEGIEGDVKDARLFLRRDRAYLSVAGEPWQAKPTTRAWTVAADFSPPAVIPMVLALGQALGTRREFSQMTIDGTREREGQIVTVLRHGGDDETDAMVLEVDEAGLVRRAGFNDGEVVHAFDDYRKVGGVMIPHEVRSTRGEATDVVVVARLEVGVGLEEEGVAIPAERALPPE
ncbi:MAG: hypothetical protein AAGA48_19580 [Myxococcota bacterium]